MTLKEITRGFLYEGVSNDEINNAINNHKYVVITYEGDDGTANGKRMIEPVSFGCTTAGFPVIRSFERFGDTKTTVPNWKYFRVDRISSWRETDKIFSEPAALFNPYDDKTMSIVYNIAKFDDTDTMSPVQQTSPKMKKDENPQLYKTETEKRMDKLRKQLENPLTLNDFKTQDAFGSLKSEKPQTNGPKMKKDENPQLYKTETEKRMDKLRKQLENPITLRDLKNLYNNTSDSMDNENPLSVANKKNNGEDLGDENRNITGSPEQNKRIKTIKDLRNLIGDTTKPITLRDLQYILKKQ